MWKKVVLISLVTVIQSCALMQQEHRQARDRDLFNRFSRHTLTAQQTEKFGVKYLIFRKNGTFIYRENLFGVFTTYYCGTYEVEEDSLKLNFSYDHTPDDINPTLQITRDFSESLCFKSDDITKFRIIDEDIYKSLVILYFSKRG